MLAYSDTTQPSRFSSSDDRHISFSDWLSASTDESATTPLLTGDLVLVDVVALPLHVRVERAPSGYYTVLDTKTGIFGQADDYDEAHLDLLAALDEFREVLARQRQLSTQLEDHLRLLEQYAGTRTP
jgi:hypothetical protein